MKFEEMKKIWDEQNKELLFVIDEKRLQQNIEEKKRKSSTLVSKIEIMLIAVNIFSGSIVLGINFQHPANLFNNAMGILMWAIAVYIFFKRGQRLKNENRFDRSLLGDLDHAISNATYQARLSYGMLFYCAGIGVLMFLNAMAENKSVTVLLVITVLFAITIYLARWEHRGWHLARKKRLEAMRAKLVE